VGGCIAASAAVKVGTSWSNCRFLELCEMRDEVRERYTVISICKQKKIDDRKSDRLFHEISGV
jgi:hypothetical protein